MMFLMCAPTSVLFSFELSTEQYVIELVPCCENMSMNLTSLFAVSDVDVPRINSNVR